MHQYRHEKLPASFAGLFTEIISSDEKQSRHNQFNYVNIPSKKSYLEKYPLKQILSNWNSLSIDLKSTGEHDEFKSFLKETLLHNYKFEMDCPLNCFSCQ